MTHPKRSHIDKLKKLRACREAIEWTQQFKTSQEAWNACERGDWMLWYAGKGSGRPKTDSRRKLVFVACQCARLSLKYTKDPRAKKAIETAEAWSKKEKGISLKDVKNAAAAAYAAASAAYAAAASAAYAAAAAAAYATYAAAAAYTAAYAAYAAAAAARLKTLKQCADIVRKHYPKPPRLK